MSQLPETWNSLLACTLVVGFVLFSETESSDTKPAKWDATSANNPPKDAVSNMSLREELLARGKKDQEIRQEFLDWAKANNVTLGSKQVDLRALPFVAKQFAVDAENQKWLKQVVEKHGWPGKSLVGEDGAQAAFLILFIEAEGFRFHGE